MNRILNILLAIGLLQYVTVWYGCIQHWFTHEKEVYAISSATLLTAFLVHHFSQKKLDRKRYLLLIIATLYLIFTTLAKYKMAVLQPLPIIILIATFLLLLLELYDWLKAKSKKHKANAIQLFGLISFLAYVIMKISHYPGAALPWMLFHFSLIGISIDLLINEKGVK